MGGKQNAFTGGATCAVVGWNIPPGKQRPAGNKGISRKTKNISNAMRELFTFIVALVIAVIVISLYGMR